MDSGEAHSEGTVVSESREVCSPRVRILDKNISKCCGLSVFP